jgi:uracil phosphoribosyltransferase
MMAMHVSQVHVPPHPLVGHWLATLRSDMTPTPVFRSAMAELGRLLVYEARLHPFAHALALLQPADGDRCLWGWSLSSLQVLQAARDWLPTMEVELQSPCGPADGIIVDMMKPVKVKPALHGGALRPAALQIPVLATAGRRAVYNCRCAAWTCVQCLKAQVVPILRAGLVPLEQIATVLPAYETYHVGLVRDEKSFEVML